MEVLFFSNISTKQSKTLSKSLGYLEMHATFGQW